jgi:hypothetical protein
MAKNPVQDRTPQAERSIARDPEEAQEPSAPASPGAPGSPPGAKDAVRPKSPREFIQERMRELDKKGS